MKLHEAQPELAQARANLRAVRDAINEAIDALIEGEVSQAIGALDGNVGKLVRTYQGLEFIQESHSFFPQPVDDRESA